jgi:large subunit ribosomal protein L28
LQRRSACGILRAEFYRKRVTWSKENAVKCELCGKKPQFGNAVSHSNRHTKRQWLPNIRATSLVTDGKRKRMTICTRCLRTRNKIAS